MKIIVASIAVIFIIYFSCLNWKRSVKTVFFLVVFEGILRKWVLPQASDLIYFLKDIVLLGAYIKYFVLSPYEKKVPIKNDFLKLIICLVAGWCLFQVFNPSLGSPIVGFFGLRGYLFYIPLMWMITNLFSSEKELYQFLRSHLLLIIPVGLLGIVQFFIPGSFLNVYAGGQDAVAGFAGTDFVRITGTFSYISGYSMFLSICFALVIPIFIKEHSLKWQIILAFAMALLIGNSLMTGSRAVILFDCLFMIGYFSLLWWQQPSLVAKYLRRFLIPIILSLITITFGLRPAFDAFINRATSSDNLSNRIVDTFVVAQYFQFKFWDGYGTGAANQATNSLRSLLNLPHGELIPIGFEQEMGRIALELGPIGFLLWYGLRISLFIALGLVFLRLRKPFLKQLALAVFLIHAIQLNGPLVTHPTFSIYYWFLTGFIFLLPRLETLEHWYHQQSNQNVLPSSSFGARYS
ncbi:unknown protein [Stanieria sp. NIES-3757]|nr:unknown protein [Stanieria sp. NIES-3757]